MTRRERVHNALSRIFPRLPARDAEAILDQAMDSRGLKTASPEACAWLSAVAYARHNHTDYDDLLADGYDVESARHFTLDALNAVLAAWGRRRRLGSEESD
jgi:hypothetical protein